ncbi:hypothetical protein PO909_017344 [Leuciscus waleckii]
MTKARVDRVKLRRAEANTRERNRMNFIPDQISSEPSFSGRSQYESVYGTYHSPGVVTPSGASVDPVKPFRPFNYCNSYETFYESVSPECGSPQFDGPISPPINFNGIFSLKQEEPFEYGKSCHYGTRYCAVPPRSSISQSARGASDLHFPYDVHLRGQFYPVQEELNTFHN